MPETSELIKHALGDGPQARTASRKLITIGMPAIPEVIAALSDLSPLENSANLCLVILNVNDPAIVPLLIDQLNAKNIDLVMTSFQALGQTHDERAFQPLIEYLSNRGNRNTRRTLAAVAIGELQDTRAIPILLEVTDEAIKQGEFNLGISTIIALAKLGNHQKAVLAIKLATHKDPTIRTKAVEALQYVVGSGVLNAAQKSLHDQYTEIRHNAIDTLFYLGVKEIVLPLIEATDDKNPGVSDHALARISDITGEEFEEGTSIKKLRKWWEINEGSYKSAICYRLGKPIWLPNIINLLDEPNRCIQILQELRIISGNDFSYDIDAIPEQNTAIRKQAETWWKNAKDQYTAGKLYKYGYQQDLTAIF